jgi:co-chaperonin GroES (HSP10)
MKPLNRRLLIEVIKEEAQQGAFFVPTEEKTSDFSIAKVVACAPDCSQDLSGKTVVFHVFGIEEVRAAGTSYTFIGENHLVCVE